MDSIYFNGSEKSEKRRNRFYSSMTYNEYEDFFGTAPKMPQAPIFKPVDGDPLEVPNFKLEDETEDGQNGTEKKIRPSPIKYKIETIPEIDGSQNNSINFQPVGKNGISFQRYDSKLEDDIEEIEEIQSRKRQRGRPRSYSENNAFIGKFRIIDFLNSKNKKNQHEEPAKKVKLN